MSRVFVHTSNPDENGKYPANPHTVHIELNEHELATSFIFPMLSASARNTCVYDGESLEEVDAHHRSRNNLYGTSRAHNSHSYRAVHRSHLIWWSDSAQAIISRGGINLRDDFEVYDFQVARCASLYTARDIAAGLGSTQENMALGLCLSNMIIPDTWDNNPCDVYENLPRHSFGLHLLESVAIARGSVKSLIASHSAFFSVSKLAQGKSTIPVVCFLLSRGWSIAEVRTFLVDNPGIDNQCEKLENSSDFHRSIFLIKDVVSSVKPWVLKTARYTGSLLPEELLLCQTFILYYLSRLTSAEPEFYRAQKVYTAIIGSNAQDFITDALYNPERVGGFDDSDIVRDFEIESVADITPIIRLAYFAYRFYAAENPGFPAFAIARNLF